MPCIGWEPIDHSGVKVRCGVPSPSFQSLRIPLSMSVTQLQERVTHTKICAGVTCFHLLMIKVDRTILVLPPDSPSTFPLSHHHSPPIHPLLQPIHPQLASIQRESNLPEYTTSQSCFSGHIRRQRRSGMLAPLHDNLGTVVHRNSS